MVLGGLFTADAAAVFSENDVLDPVQSVLDLPVLLHQLAERASRGLASARDVVQTLLAARAVDGPYALDADDPLQSDPLRSDRVAAVGLRCPPDIDGTLDAAAMAAREAVIGADRCLPVAEAFDRLMERRLVALDGDQIVVPTADDAFDELFLQCSASSVSVTPVHSSCSIRDSTAASSLM